MQRTSLVGVKVEHRMAGSRRANTFFPPATRDTFKDVLIFEERLKQNAERCVLVAERVERAGKLTDPLLRRTGYRSRGGSMKVSARTGDTEEGL